MRTDLLFWDVDSQNDFVLPDGKLYVPTAEETLPALRRLTDFAHAHGIRILASADDHLPGHPELSGAPDFVETFPEHCMHGTHGQAKVPETELRHPLIVEPAPVDPDTLAQKIRHHDGDILVHKEWFDVFTNPNTLPIVDALSPGRIVLYGHALDYCVRYAVEGLRRHRPRIQLAFVTDASRPIDAAAAPGLLAAWRRLGVELTTVDEVTAA